MEKEVKEKLINLCNSVAKDVEQDARAIDGMPFNGATVGTILGQNAAAIKALCSVLSIVIKDIK